VFFARFPVHYHSAVIQFIYAVALGSRPPDLQNVSDVRKSLKAFCRVSRLSARHCVLVTVKNCPRYWSTLDARRQLEAFWEYGTQGTALCVLDSKLDLVEAGKGN
ncbi:unnamed protein product, partial [Porites lobata]